MHNLGDIVACFLWGSIAGTQSKLMKIKLTPNSGFIKPGESLKVDVQLTPLELGLFEHLYVPCFVGKMDDPIMLRIFCFVENIFVNIHLPNEKGKFDVVYWPPRMINEFEISPSEYDYLNKEFLDVRLNDIEKGSLFSNILNSVEINFYFRKAILHLTLYKEV